MLEAIEMCQEITGNELRWDYSEKNRNGDHIWWITDLSKFRSHYPDWRPEYDVPRILREISEVGSERWSWSMSR
jgi:CDP-paratose 2-epimerase